MRLTVVPNDVGDIDGRQVLHVRHIVKLLELPASYGAETRIQVGLNGLYCKEPPGSVVILVNQERLASGMLALSELTLPGGKPVWFAAEASEGPIYLEPIELGDGIHSVFQIGKMRTYVRNTPQEVAAIIKAGGGKVRPIPRLKLPLS
jgi:hypothetical protein